jgi:uncharacterized OB-fold protein
MSEREFSGKSFYDYVAEEKLMGARCQSCGELFVPPRAICPDCYGEEMAWEEMGGHGELVAFTTVHIAPTAMIEAGYGRDNPYCAGIVKLEEGPSVSAQILGVDPARPDEIEIGTPLHVRFIRRGEGDAEKAYLAFEKE